MAILTGLDNNHDDNIINHKLLFIYLFIYMLIYIRLIDRIFTRILMFSIRTSRQVPVMVSAAF